MKKLIVLILAILSGLGGCTPPPGGLRLFGPEPIQGRVAWQTVYATQAVTSEVANGATVSLIDAGTGQTVATTLTQPDGAFSLSIAGWTPVPNQVYLLEAVKGLSGGGQPNRVGAAAARVRTMVSRVGNAWVSLTAGTLQISRSTTALSVIAGLKGLNAAQQQALLGRVTIGTPDTFPGTPEVSPAEYAAVWGMVDAALTLDQDPVRVIARDVSAGTFVRLERGPIVSDFSTLSGAWGSNVVLHGSGFNLTSGNNKVYFSGTQATSVSVDATGTQLTVTVPTGAVSGPLTVQVGNLVSSAVAFFWVTTGSIETLVGAVLPPPSGTAATAWPLPLPTYMAVDGSGNVYMTSNGTHMVYRIATDGVISVVAGNGEAGFSGDGGPATSARLSTPQGLALDAAGNLYIADYLNQRVRKVATNGLITTVAGTGTVGYAGDGGLATSALFNGPRSLAVDAAGNLYIGDLINNVVRKVAPNGTITTIAGTGTAGYTGDGGPATSATLNLPEDVCLDASGNLYIVEYTNSTVRKVVLATGIITTVAGTGTSGYSGDGGPATSAQLYSPYGVVADTAGNLYIADYRNHRIRKVTPGGTITTIAGTGVAGYSGDNGPASAAQLNWPLGVAVDPAGNLFLSDTLNYRVRKVSGAGVITTYGGTGVNASANNVPASTALLGNPRGLAFDSSGALYFAEGSAHRIRKVTSGGMLVTVAGNGTPGYSGDGGAATSAQLQNPYGLCFDAADNLYIADGTNDVIRKVATNGTITTVAGNGTGGYTGDNGPATSARLNSPMGVLADAAGDLYIAESANNVVRKVSSTGTITTVAGTSVRSYSGDDGPATSATLNQPFGLARDIAGNLYIADWGNHRVRKVATNGTITTFAGNGTGGYSGDNGPATSASLNNPACLTLDAAGNLYIGEWTNGTIRRVTPTGTITTVAGTGIKGFSGDRGPATSAQLDRPTGLAFDLLGRLHITDLNLRIRRINP